MARRAWLAIASTDRARDWADSIFSRLEKKRSRRKWQRKKKKKKKKKEDE